MEFLHSQTAATNAQEIAVEEVVQLGATTK
jgi:hypothetical protein